MFSRPPLGRNCRGTRLYPDRMRYKDDRSVDPDNFVTSIDRSSGVVVAKPTRSPLSLFLPYTTTRSGTGTLRIGTGNKGSASSHDTVTWRRFAGRRIAAGIGPALHEAGAGMPLSVAGDTTSGRVGTGGRNRWKQPRPYEAKLIE